MRKILITGSAIAVFLGFVACKKSDSKSNARTVENFSGSYAITALTGNFGGLSINIYDTLPACDKDNLIQLNTNMTAAFVDAGTKCAPPVRFFRNLEPFVKYRYTIFGWFGWLYKILGWVCPGISQYRKHQRNSNTNCSYYDSD